MEAVAADASDHGAISGGERQSKMPKKIIKKME
jgi:hypothetical protein